MLDYVLDNLLTSLRAEINIKDKILQSEATSPDKDDVRPAIVLLRTKRCILEVMTSCMEQLSNEGEIRVYSDLRYIEAVSLLVSYSSLHGGPNAELEKCLRIFVEVYLSRTTNVELLI
jgi:hypothetical protein